MKNLQKVLEKLTEIIVPYLEEDIRVQQTYQKLTGGMNITGTQNCEIIDKLHKELTSVLTKLELERYLRSSQCIIVHTKILVSYVVEPKDKIK